ncbi:MAG TPA: hypothetical protein VN937_06305 [Blastocatellia bacterium]|nr:hypothetical protein [Blastocatellia bacterium]
MKIRTTSTTVFVMALLALAAGSYFDRQTVVANDKERFEFGSEIEHPFGEKAVKGAPFSAQVTFDTTQTLANGVHVSHKMTGMLYRDSEGRTRQELPRDGAPEIVFINDNVAGARYDVNMLQRTVTKLDVSEVRLNGEIETRSRVRRENEEREQKEKMTARRAQGKEPQRKVESLGSQTFEGLQAEVTRFTITIPAGSEGNDQPFDIVSERWFSPELQIAVMGKRNDPRSGEVVYRLTNINRSEPSHALFEAPADFTVTEEKMMMRRRSQ